jgi:hypothetical protein
MSPWPGFPRSSRTLFAQEIHKRSHQRDRSFSSKLVRPESDGSPRRSPRGGDSKGTSCRRVQSTFFYFQKRATTSRATIRFAFEPKLDRSPMDRSVHAERPALAGQPPNTRDLSSQWCRQSSRTSDAPSPPRLPDRHPCGLRSFFRLGLARFHHQPMTANGFHQPERLPPTRPLVRARPTRTARSVPKHRCISRGPEDPPLDPLPLVASAAESS